MRLDYQNESRRIFEGFYDSNLFNLDIVNDNTDEVWKIDFKPYCESIAQYATQLLKDYCILNRGGEVIKDIKYKNLYSPRYYNFTTDKLNFEIDFNLNKLKRFIKENETDFNHYLKDNFTSYDGFMSFIDNNILDFIDTFKNDASKKSQYLNIMIEYYILTCIYNSKWHLLINKHWNKTEYHSKLYEYADTVLYEYIYISQVT